MKVPKIIPNSEAQKANNSNNNKNNAKTRKSNEWNLLTSNGEHSIKKYIVIKCQIIDIEVIS